MASLAFDTAAQHPSSGENLSADTALELFAEDLASDGALDGLAHDAPIALLTPELFSRALAEVTLPNTSARLDQSIALLYQDPKLHRHEHRPAHRRPAPRHSGIRFVSPAQRHAGVDTAILLQRKRVYETARARIPQRWSGSTRNWQRVEEVHLNPDRANSKTTKPKEEEETMRKAA